MATLPGPQDDIGSTKAAEAAGYGADSPAVEVPRGIMSEVAAKTFQAAAQAVRNADFLLLASGAGLSADSGLATFATLTAKMGAQLGEGVTYDHAAGSDTMARDPGLFYAFWLACHRNYQTTEPHAGYDILREWRLLVEGRRKDTNAGLSGPARPAFVLTSNVDGWSILREVAARDGLAQIHGSIHQWQCGGTPSGKRFPTFRKDRCCDELFEPPSAEGMDFDALPLRYSQAPPRCPRCKDGWLRPHIYLFGDGSRFVNKEEVTGEQSFRLWQEETLAALRANPAATLAIVEIGCGLRVPNIRKRCETLFAKSPAGQCEFVRINPESTEQEFEAKPTVYVQASALEALKQIHFHVLEPASSEGSKHVPIARAAV
eukprot:TRINITY_DN111854_c0_g1_i1.p1 TRINITY_DN111854_c0_g1~~TRINITY_DN111854_c0_g1_i1.p1  ORF type:complete len:414 (-),score=24.80 TRINITY_DN111854_c0_g1_i1:153-1274(-)